jgi:hypothetical protein
MGAELNCSAPPIVYQTSRRRLRLLQVGDEFGIGHLSELYPVGIKGGLVVAFFLSAKNVRIQMIPHWKYHNMHMEILTYADCQ